MAIALRAQRSPGRPRQSSAVERIGSPLPLRPLSLPRKWFRELSLKILYRRTGAPPTAHATRALHLGPMPGCDKRHLIAPARIAVAKQRSAFGSTYPGHFRGRPYAVEMALVGKPCRRRGRSDPAGLVFRADDKLASDQSIERARGVERRRIVWISGRSSPDNHQQR